MRFDRFTTKSQEAVQRTQDLARQTESPDVSVEHQLLALIDQKEAVVKPILQKVGADTQSIKSEVDEAIQKSPTVQGSSQKQHISAGLKEVFYIAWKETTNPKR